MKKLFLTPLKAYQYISKFTPASCRYYPTCSEYAKWLYIFDNPLSATLKSAKRIATCNQLFSGGIDYPKIKYTPPKLLCLKNFNKTNSPFIIKFWLVPDAKNRYYIIKDLDGTKINFTP